MTWEDCVVTAKANNPSLKAYGEALNSARHKYYMARNKFYPSVDASNSVSRSDSGAGAKNSWNAGVTAQETLFNAKYTADLKVQLAAVEQAQAQYRQAGADLRKDLYSAFVGLVYAQEKVKLLGDIAALRQKSAKTVGLQYENGMESKGNKMRSDALLLQAKSELDKSARDLTSAQWQLSEAMGMENLRNIEAKGELALPSQSAGADVEAAAQNSPEAELSRTFIKSAEHQLKGAGAEIFPTLSATQSLGWLGEDEFPQKRNWSVGLRLSLPIFSGGLTYAANSRKSAQSSLEKVRQDYRRTMLLLKTSAQDALNALLSAIDDIKVKEMLLKAARQRHSEASVQYVAARLSFESWGIIEQELVNAEKDWLGALYSANIAKAAWDRISGTGL
ncbi:MAG: TolC family protein [Elusimicrobia bacterium]|nr:TolC family protein [Elusimicrobiota bacterium]